MSARASEAPGVFGDVRWCGYYYHSVTGNSFAKGTHMIQAA